MSVRRAEEFGRDGVFLCRSRPPVWGWEKGSGNLAGIRELSSAFAEAPEAALVRVGKEMRRFNPSFALAGWSAYET